MPCVISITEVLVIVLLFYVIRQARGDTPVLVLRSGIRLFDTYATSITFFATVENMGLHSVVAGIQMERCCQKITEKDMDCESMALHSGLRVELYPGDIRNLTIFYTNHYLRDREGECALKVKWRQPSKPLSSQIIKIPFDTRTRLPLPNFLHKLFKTAPGSTYRECESVDEDPRRGCFPVKCLVKYSGHRSFFNRTQRRCVKTEKCLNLSDVTKETEKRPDVILSPVSNKCKNIKTDIVFTEDMMELRDIKEVAVLSYTKYPVNIRCIHGYRNESELCICDEGWKSKTFPAKTFNPERDVYIMCDQVPAGTVKGMQTASSSHGLILAGLIVVLILVFCCYLPYIFHRYSTRRAIKKLSEELSSPSSDSLDVDRDPDNISVVSETKSPSTFPASTRVSRSSSKPELVEFSDLALDEQTTKPDVAVKLFQGSYDKSPPLYLRFPESFQLKPLCRPKSPPPLSSSSSESCVNEEWSIPDTLESDSAPCLSHSLLQFSENSPLAASCSLDSFPRRVCSVSQPCSCTCCSNFEAVQPLLSIKVQTNDPNQNTYVTVRKFLPAEACMSLEKMKFPGPSPKFIAKVAEEKWNRELEDLLKTLRPPEESFDFISENSSSSSLTEFWEGGEEKARREYPNSITPPSSSPQEVHNFLSVIKTIKNV